MNMRCQITMPSGACFGLIVEAGRVKQAAPIGAWSIGKDWETVRKWFLKKGGQVVRVG